MKYANVEEEYKKCPELKREEVAKLVDWIGKQPHLPKVTELEVMLFLHSNYYSVEATKKTIDEYYTCRTHVPEFFANRDIMAKEMRTTMDLVMITPLPQRTKEGYVVVLAKLLNSDASNFSLTEALKLLNYIIDVYLNENGISSGYVVVLDMSGVTLGHVARLGLMTIKKFLFYLQEAMPVRLKGLHWINVVPFIDKILILVKPFMKRQLLDVFKLHTTDDTLYPYVPKELLPNEYGGRVGDSKAILAEFYKHILKEKDFFLEEEKTKRIDESKRPGKPKNVGDVFGIDGNFRKLDID